jgi:HAD superfamily hydrolase (TIGR01450 family)
VTLGRRARNGESATPWGVTEVGAGVGAEVTIADRTQRGGYAIIPRVPSTLASSAEPLASRYDVALLDLDGVVYIGPAAVPHAREALAAARALGMRLAFVTNNAARPPSAVADQLTELGVAADQAEVVTSAQAAAHHLAQRLPAGAPVLVVGTTGLHEALVERGLTPVTSADDQPQAVVQGYSPELTWRQLAEGAVAINRGVPWVATNLDATVPSTRGRLPGNGAMVAALRYATGREPASTGKPDPAMHQESVDRSGARRPIVVGDRLDTDIAGANAVGAPSLLVLTGVTSVAETLEAPAGARPSYLAADLRGLLDPHPAVSVSAGRASCRGWVVAAERDALLLRTESEPGARSPSAGSAEDDWLDAVRALAVAAWRVTDEAGEGGWRPRVRGDGAAAGAALDRADLGRFRLD